MLGHPAEYRSHETGVTLDYGLMPSVDKLKVQKLFQSQSGRDSIDTRLSSAGFITSYGDFTNETRNDAR